MKIIGFIPARFASSRFPGKPLVDIQGKTMIQRVWEQASKASSLDRVVVLTDDQRIFDHVSGFGGEVLMTSSDHATGTDRILEAMKSYDEYDAAINIQGDEPFISPEAIDKVARPLQGGDAAFVSTLVKKITDLSEVKMSSIIKVVLRPDGTALYFSRSPIPFVRDEKPFAYLKHIGIYGYTKSALKEIQKMKPGVLEQAESLEQLRWMENGLPIITQFTDHESISIDTPEDLNRILGKMND